MILAPLLKLPKNVGDLGKLIVAKGFKKLPKVQKIANSGHTDWQTIFVWLRNDQIIFLGSEFDVIFGQCDHIERFITIWATF